jgi:hypothetical protein
MERTRKQCSTSARRDFRFRVGPQSVAKVHRHYKPSRYRLEPEEIAVKAPSSPRWQFSVRGMLLFTALVAGVLSFAVKLPDLFRFALIMAAIGSFIAAIMETANFATSERRPRLATFSWLAFGLFFTLFATLGGLTQIREFRAGFRDPVAMGILVVMSLCAVLCFYRATRAFLGRAASGHSPSRHSAGELDMK